MEKKRKEKENLDLELLLGYNKNTPSKLRTLRTWEDGRRGIPWARTQGFLCGGGDEGAEGLGRNFEYFRAHLLHTLCAKKLFEYITD